MQLTKLAGKVPYLFLQKCSMCQLISFYEQNQIKMYWERSRLKLETSNI